MPENTNTPQTGPEAILHALQQLNADGIEAEGKQLLQGGKKTKRGRAVALLNIAKGLRRNELTPEDYMISAVPVIPPQFRPFAAQGGTFIPGDANVLYKDLFDVRDAHSEEADVFGADNAGDSRLDLYDAVRSVYGYGEPVKAKTAAKGVEGFLKKITGSTSKYGFVNRKLLSKTQDNVARSTIIVDPELGIDELGMPREAAMVMFAPYVQRRLKLSGLKDSEALKAVRDRSEIANRALEKEMTQRPVLYARAPAWHGLSVVAAWAKPIEGKAIATNPYTAVGLGADYDGDANRSVVTVYVDLEHVKAMVDSENYRHFENYARLTQRKMEHCKHGNDRRQM